MSWGWQPNGKIFARIRGGAWIRAAHGLHGLQEGLAEAHLVRCYGWHGLPSSLSLCGARSSLYAHGISWHESGEALRILDVFFSCWRSSIGREESHPLEPYLNYNVDKLGRRDRDAGIGPYSWTSQLLIGYPEKEENVAYSRAFPAMHFWLGWFAVSLELRER